MAQNDFHFITPENWTEILPEQYDEFSIISTPHAPCLLAFVSQHQLYGCEVVAMHDYGDAGDDFFNDYVAALKKLKEDNTCLGNIQQYLDNTAASKAVTQELLAMRPIYFGHIKVFGKSAFLSILNVNSEHTFHYSFQVFVRLEHRTLCFNTSIPFIDEKDPLQGALEDSPFLQELFDVLIRSLH